MKPSINALTRHQCNLVGNRGTWGHHDDTLKQAVQVFSRRIGALGVIHVQNHRSTCLPLRHPVKLAQRATQVRHPAFLA